jgi:hypothetical protein
MIAKRRSAVSLIEVQVAFVIFGIALSGLGPLVVMHLRHVQKLEGRLNDTATYYLAPSSDPWVAKLGSPATISSTSPDPGTAPSVAVTNIVEIVSLEKTFTSEDVTAQVSLTGIPQ